MMANIDFCQAVSYENNCSSYQREDGLNLVSLLDLQKGYKVLDLGCGTGYLTSILADHVGPQGKVVAIDPDVERLDMAREKYATSNVVYLEGTAENIPGNDKDFDIVFSNYVVHWCKDKEAVLKEVAAKLKKSGRFGFVYVNTDAVKHLDPPEMFSQEFISYFSSTFHHVSWEEFAIIALNVGFQVSKVHHHTQETKFTGVDELIEMYRTHTKGRFNRSHFNADAMVKHFGEGEFCVPRDIATVVLSKI